jgi:AhpD family alkylhydroperoxidase
VTLMFCFGSWETSIEPVSPSISTVREYFSPSTSPATLASLVALQGEMSKTLDARIRNGIALAVSEVNGCCYCISAHSYVAANLTTTPPEEIAAPGKKLRSDSS